MKFCGLSAKLYDYVLWFLFLGKEKKIRQQITELIPKNKKIRILDIGCGTGSQLIEIKTKREEVGCFGIDSSKDMLKIANQKAEVKKIKVNFSKQNFSSLSFKKNYFDFVIAFLALHEVSYEERKAAIKEIERVMKKTGSFILVDFKKTQDLARAIQKSVFFVFEKYADNFIETKEKLLKNFNRKYSKEVLKILSIEKYKKLN